MGKHYGIFKDWKMILIMFAVSIAIAFVAFYTKNGFMKFLNIISWAVFSFYLYKDIFLLINQLDMANDLLLLGLRVIGGIVGAGAFFVSLFLFFGGAIGNFDPITMGLSVVFFGLGCLGGFMVFRSKRRYGHLYVNR